VLDYFDFSSFSSVKVTRTDVLCANKQFKRSADKRRNATPSNVLLESFEFCITNEAVLDIVTILDFDADIIEQVGITGFYCTDKSDKWDLKHESACFLSQNLKQKFIIAIEKVEFVNVLRELLEFSSRGITMINLDDSKLAKYFSGTVLDLQEFPRYFLFCANFSTVDIVSNMKDAEKILRGKAHLSKAQRKALKSSEKRSSELVCEESSTSLDVVKGSSANRYDGSLEQDFSTFPPLTCGLLVQTFPGHVLQVCTSSDRIQSLLDSLTLC